MRNEARMITWLRYAACALTALFGCPVMAQSPSDPLIVPENDLVDLSRNEIRLPGDHRPWDGFNEKLDKLFFDGTGQVNICLLYTSDAADE